MTLPAFVQSGTGATDAGGAWTYTGAAGTAGHLVILQVLQDGTTAASVTLTSGTNIENLAGTDNTWTSIGVFNVGTAPAALQHFWIGRLINTSAPTATGGNSGTDDIYMRTYQFSGVHTGTTLADVIENSTAGSTANGTGNGTSVTDTAVTTLGADRLALQFYAANDDVLIGALPGSSGGTWDAFEVQQYATSTGTDGAIALLGANMASAGTIDGGSATQSVATPWGIVGFALISVPSAAQPPRYGYTNFQDPGLF